ncbi:MAG: hypothetical protein VXW65_01605 [Pseudomonadota bacterium]|nr:hypothetical protein [Pseudomonadota bacterium]
MKAIGWFFLIVFGLIAVLAAGLSLMMYKGGIEREKRIAGIRQENLEYKEKVERLCVFPSGYAPTVSGKIFNLTQYNLALKYTIFDNKKDIVYQSWNYSIIDNQYRLEFAGLRPNGVQYEILGNQCYIADVILPLTFDHQSQKLSIGGTDWESGRDSVIRDDREDFFAYICLRKRCEGQPPVYVPLTKSADADFTKPLPNREFFEDKRFPDIIFYADFNRTEKRSSGKEYSDYSVYMQHKFIKQSGGRYYKLEMHLPSILGSQGNPSVFNHPVFLEKIELSQRFYTQSHRFDGFSFYFNGGSIHPESFSTNVLPIMTEFMQAVQAYPQQFISDREPQ